MAKNANPVAFARAKQMAEGIQPHPFTKIGSRALEGWGDNVQPPRPKNFFTGAKGPIDRPAAGKLPVANIWATKAGTLI